MPKTLAKISCLYIYISSFYLVAFLTLATFLAPCRANQHTNLQPGKCGFEERCDFYEGGDGNVQALKKMKKKLLNIEDLRLTKLFLLHSPPQ